MRSYTNSNGEIVEVSIEHLEKSVDIKLALQDMSPGRRCDWHKHKQIMEEEGFPDSDTNEAYRCLVKNYQKEIGKLHNLPKHIDLVTESKIEIMKKLIPEIRFEQQINKDILKELNKVYREMTRTAVAVEELKDIYIDEISWDVPQCVYEPKLPSTGTKGIVVLTDWHIGAIVNDSHGNSFNLKIAEKRLKKLKQEVIYYIKMFNITDLYIIGLGDWIEHLYMRKNQSQHAEFGVNMQVAKAQSMLWKFILGIASSKLSNIIYGGIAGNHDRANGDKDFSFDGDNANVIITHGIKDMLSILKKHNKAERIELLDLTGEETSIKININGKIFKFTHGDEDSKKNVKDRMKAFISMDNEFYDYWIHGHLHHYYIQEDDHGRMIISIGSLMGRNNYSAKINSSTNASQGMIVVREDGQIIPFKIDLQIT